MKRRLSDFKKPSGLLRRFQRSEDGSFTLEAVIWMPIFAILLAIIMNLSMVFYYESQILRITQDATRAFSLGRFDDGDSSTDSRVLAEQFILSRLDFIDAEFEVDVSTRDTGNGIVAQSTVSTNAAALMPFSLMSAPFQGVPIGVYTSYMIEF